MEMQKGKIGLWMLFVITVALLGIMFTGGASHMGTKSASAPKTKTLLVQDDTVDNSKDQNLQLKAIKFTEVQPTSDCGHEAIKGMNEAFILWAVSPGPTEYASPGGSIKAFYTDEWPLTLGAGNVSTSKKPSHLESPNVGDETKKDANGFPYFPAIFITDITNNPDDRSGDAQNGGKAYKPDEIFGTWQALKSKTTKMALANTATYAEGGSSCLGEGADPFPSTSNLIKNEKSVRKAALQGYCSEIIWKVDNLGLTQGHTYRAQIILHDGDFEGDIGQACTTIKY